MPLFIGSVEFQRCLQMYLRLVIYRRSTLLCTGQRAADRRDQGIADRAMKISHISWKLQPFECRSIGDSMAIGQVGKSVLESGCRKYDLIEVLKTFNSKCHSCLSFLFI